MYVTLPDIGLTTPRLQLRGFAKAKDVAPGQFTYVTVGLDKYAFAFWDVRKGCWAVRKGRYEIAVGRSCMDLPLSAAIELESDMEWTGI